MGRIIALKALFVLDSGPVLLNEALNIAYANALEEEPEGLSATEGEVESVKPLVANLVESYWPIRGRLDPAIAHSVTGYDFNRLAAIDRCILRLGYSELLNLAYVPPAVTINEMIELAKLYSTTESGKFVNGVMAQLLAKTDKVNFDASCAPPDPYTKPEKPTEEVVQVVEVETADPEMEKLGRRFGVWDIGVKDPS